MRLKSQGREFPALSGDGGNRTRVRRILQQASTSVVGVFVLVRWVAADRATSGTADALNSPYRLGESCTLTRLHLAPVCQRNAGGARSDSPIGLQGPSPAAYAATATGAQRFAIGVAFVFCSWVYGDGASPTRSLPQTFPVETYHPHPYYTTEWDVVAEISRRGMSYRLLGRQGRNLVIRLPCSPMDQLRTQRDAFVCASYHGAKPRAQNHPRRGWHGVFAAKGCYLQDFVSGNQAFPVSYDPARTLRRMASTSRNMREASRRG